MNWINTLIPVATLIIGWALSEFGKFSSERKNDRKKLKRLLFNLLEIRWLLKRHFDLEADLSRYIERLEIKLGQEVAQGAHSIKPILNQILKDKLLQPNRIEEIEKSIGKTIDDLSEIYPIFAYELTEVYRIRERVEGIENYFEEVSEIVDYVPQDMKDWAKPKFSNELLKRLDDYILDISGKISRKTKRSISRIYLKTNSSEDVEEIDRFIDEYILNFNL